MVDYFVNRRDYEISRDYKNHPGSAVVYDCDGDRLLTVDCNSWSDAQIHAAIRLANDWYGIGLQRGRDEKAREIRVALGLYGEAS